MFSDRSKSLQMQGAREIDERRRTLCRTLEEAIERNEADEDFSTVWRGKRCSQHLTPML
jgi:hypothetical protein